MDSDLKKEMVVLDTHEIYARSIKWEKMAPDLKSKGKKPGSTRSLLG